MFKNYESKPVTRKAHEITEDSNLKKVSATGADHGGVSSVGHGDQVVNFVHHEKVSVGDFVVYLNDEDVYHCNRKVFLERNIVE